MKSAPGPALSSPLPECAREPAPAQLPPSGAGGLPPALGTALPAGLAQQGTRPRNSAVPGGTLRPHALSTPWDGGPPDSADGLPGSGISRGSRGGKCHCHQFTDGETTSPQGSLPCAVRAAQHRVPPVTTPFLLQDQVRRQECKSPRRGGDLLAGKLDSASPPN